jgi:hypothetical protein
VGRGGGTHHSGGVGAHGSSSARTRVVQPNLPTIGGCTWLWVATEAGHYIFMSQVRQKNVRACPVTEASGGDCERRPAKYAGYEATRWLRLLFATDMFSGSSLLLFLRGRGGFLFLLCRLFVNGLRRSIAHNQFAFIEGLLPAGSCCRVGRSLCRLAAYGKHELP